MQENSTMRVRHTVGRHRPNGSCYQGFKIMEVEKKIKNYQKWSEVHSKKMRHGWNSSLSVGGMLHKLKLEQKLKKPKR